MHLKVDLLRVHSSGTERERDRPPDTLDDLRIGAGTEYARGTKFNFQIYFVYDLLLSLLSGPWSCPTRFQGLIAGQILFYILNSLGTPLPPLCDTPPFPSPKLSLCTQNNVYIVRLTGNQRWSPWEMTPRWNKVQFAHVTLNTTITGRGLTMVVYWSA